MLNSNVGFLAIDLPGHGYSSWLPMGAVYNFRYYLATIKTIMVTLNWTKVSLMGHSMGGIMCFLFTIMFNKDVDFLICLDGLKPAINRNRLESFGRSISQYFKYHDQAVGHSEPPSYVIKDIIEKICAPNSNSVLPEYARNLFQRNIAPSKLNTGKLNISVIRNCIKNLNLKHQLLNILTAASFSNQQILNKNSNKCLQKTIYK